ncbi:hypothetical protein [Treponema sp. OMZ 857]|uniref:hypothetical protein n=1 Tax=Treponema sp. OMZ 857 TaxID=1643513 RepID=UPI0020A465F2|nr:hypothetical protein [Treponema sp. OMZ 857]UTC43412.1 hypothetical protein E4N66_04585 [Treponema sp. OMZ 857]
MDNFNKTDDLYDPNFSIDSKSTEKLDMYGVWLKKKKDSNEPLDSDDSQFVSTSDIEPDQDSINFDDDFSFSDMAADTEIPELDELSDINTSTEIPLETPAPSYSDSDTSDIALDENSFESLDLDDFLSDDSSAETAPKESSEAFVEEEPIDLDFTEITDDTEQHSNTNELPAGLENFSEISLEDFEDAAPAESSGSDDGFETVDDFNDIFADDASETQEAGHSEQKEETVLDIDVTADDEGAKEQPLSALSSQIVEDNADISIFGTETDDKSPHTEEPAFFDDVEAVKEDLLSTQQVTEPEAEPVKPALEKDSKETMDTTAVPFQRTAAEQDKATELLMQIAHEISDLKAELNSLKAGMTAQAKVTSEAPVKDAAAHTENKAADTESSGFFSDDDTDETIALTGDELNNILITADFTEERNAEDGERASADEEAPAETTETYEVPPVLTKDIDPEIQETASADHAFEDSIAEPASEETNNDYKPEAEGEKLLASDPVFNVDPTPITSLPEDLSYLDDQSEVTDEDMGLIDGDTEDHQEIAELEDIEDAESVDDDADFEDINIESFDIPTEQEIEVPSEDMEAVDNEIQSSKEMKEERTIHELQNDEDFPNPFDDDSAAGEDSIKEEIIEEPFIAEVPAIESEGEEAQSGAHEDTFEALDTAAEDAIPELESEPETESVPEEPKQETLLQAASRKRETISIPLELKNEIKSVLSYMDQLLEALPEKKIEEFAKSEYFETYKHLFEELGIS